MLLRPGKYFIWEWRGAVIILAFSLIFCMVFGARAFAGLPEPGIVLYGKVFDETGALVTTGELEWTFSPVSGGNPVSVSTMLSQIDAEGGPYSYRVTIPLESELPGVTSSGNAIPISEAAYEYTRTGLLKGTSISRTDTVVISTDSRGTFELVTIGSPAITDNDGDEMDDNWEQLIVNADPNDGINSIEDVLGDDDFDNDGESNATEYQHGTDPTDAMSTFDPRNAYTSFHFEIYRGAEQTEDGSFVDSFWGAKLVCWPREGEIFESGNLFKPQGTEGEQVVELTANDSGDLAMCVETDYENVTELMDDYISGKYRVDLIANDGGDSFHLRFKIKVPNYGEENFPQYVKVESLAPGEIDVPVAPLLVFDSGMWDYLQITETATGKQAYFHFRDGDDVPADSHQIPEEAALDHGTAYTLGVDINRWGTRWLGSQTILDFVTVGTPCDCDLDHDGDVDGQDLALFLDAFGYAIGDTEYNPEADFDNNDIVDSDDLSIFAGDYGKSGCEPRP